MFKNTYMYPVFKVLRKEETKGKGNTYMKMPEVATAISV